MDCATRTEKVQSLVGKRFKEQQHGRDGHFSLSHRFRNQICHLDRLDLFDVFVAWVFFFSFPSFQTAEGLTFSNSAFISHLKRAASCTVQIMSLCYIIGCSEYTHTHTHTHVEKWGHVRVVNNRNMNFKDFVKCCLTPWSSFLHVNFSPLIPQSGLKDLGFFSSLSFLKKNHHSWYST